MIDNEIARYKSKKPSSVSKSRVKSNHKHIYEACKLRYKETYNIPGKTTNVCSFEDLGEYCIICGKIGERSFLHSTKDAEEFNTKHPDAPIFDISGFSDKFVKCLTKD